MWQAAIHVTELRDLSKPIFQAQAEDDDPAALMDFLFHKAIREPIFGRIRHLNLQTDGLSVVLFLGRKDSPTNFSAELLKKG